ncbi:MAG TPA: response regulator [Steroidobacteraceae bacterium]|nr:response regulator [Steroidobacteraceae bacterium]
MINIAAEAATILLVEDNDVDRESVRRAFQRHRIENQVVEVVDGVEALDVMRGVAGIEALQRPYLVLLDLALPRIDGHTVLREMRADPLLRDSIVFVLTTSKDAGDVKACYEQQVAGYLVKGEVGSGLKGLAELIQSYANVVRFPNGHH